jgi:hypothetical protein
MDFSNTNTIQRTCLNGHVISNQAEFEPAAQPWCHLCGAATIDHCPACAGPLRGAYKYGLLPPDPKPDHYCLHCGKPLPWTEIHLAAVREIAEHIETFNELDRETLNQILPDLVAGESTPKTQIGVIKMKALLKKGGADFMEAANKVLVDVVSEVVKKALFP